MLTDARPVDVTTDYGPGLFAVYGLVRDGVTAVSIRVGGATRPAALAHNAFSFSDDELGGSDGLAGDAIATMRDGTTRTARFQVGSAGDPFSSP